MFPNKFQYMIREVRNKLTPVGWKRLFIFLLLILNIVVWTSIVRAEEFITVKTPDWTDKFVNSLALMAEKYPEAFWCIVGFLALIAMFKFWGKK